MTAGFKLQAPIDQQSLTIMAKRARDGNREVNVEGENDYVERAVETAWDIIMHSDSIIVGDGTKFEIGIGIHKGRASARSPWWDRWLCCPTGGGVGR